MYITNPIRKDGFGAQFQCILFHLLYAELYGYKFAYREFSSMEHNYENDTEFLEKKEILINFKNNFPNLKSISPTEIVVPDITKVYRDVENNIDICTNSPTFQSVKKIFLSNKNYQKKGDIEKVAIHIRRWNTHDEENQEFRYTENEYFLNAVEQLKLKYPLLKEIVVHSQGLTTDFEVFSELGCNVKLNQSIENTFYELVTSDILVMCRSSLSYSAGLLSDGIVYYLPFWHKPKSTWLKF